MKYPLVLHPLAEHKYGLQRQVYLEDLKEHLNLDHLKEYLKKEKPLGKHNLDNFLMVFDEILNENSLPINHCIADGNLSMNGEKIGFWGTDMPKSYFLSWTSKTYNTFFCPDCYKKIRIGNIIPNKAKMNNIRQLAYSPNSI